MPAPAEGLGGGSFAARLPRVPSQQPPPRPREARVTLGLFGVCFAVFVWTLSSALSSGSWSEDAVASLWNLSDPDAFERTGGLVLTRVWLDAQWWRVVTAGLVHGSWLHLGLNAWALWDVGRWTERAFGPSRQLALFWVSSVTGCLASLAWAEAPIVVGASAGIFGIASALVVARRFGVPSIRRSLDPIAAGRLAFWLGLWLIVGWQLPILANAGHLGGAIAGVGVGVVFACRGRWVRMLAGVGVLALIAVLALVGRAPAYRANYHLFAGLAELRSGETARGLGHLNVALDRRPDDPVTQNAVAYALALEGIDLQRAEQLSRASLSSSPEQADFLDTLGWIYCRDGRVEEGLATLRQAEAVSALPIAEISEHLANCGNAAVR
jgi:membrane associated rhomboid family serine protease